MSNGGAIDLSAVQQQRQMEGILLTQFRVTAITAVYAEMVGINYHRTLVAVAEKLGKNRYIESDPPTTEEIQVAFGEMKIDLGLPSDIALAAGDLLMDKMFPGWRGTPSANRK